MGHVRVRRGWWPISRIFGDGQHLVQPIKKGEVGRGVPLGYNRIKLFWLTLTESETSRHVYIFVTGTTCGAVVKIDPRIRMF